MIFRTFEWNSMWKARIRADFMLILSTLASWFDIFGRHSNKLKSTRFAYNSVLPSVSTYTWVVQCTLHIILTKVIVERSRWVNHTGCHKHITGVLELFLEKVENRIMFEENFIFLVIFLVKKWLADWLSESKRLKRSSFERFLA